MKIFGFVISRVNKVEALERTNFLLKTNVNMLQEHLHAIQGKKPIAFHKASEEDILREQKLSDLEREYKNLSWSYCELNEKYKNLRDKV